MIIARLTARRTRIDTRSVRGLVALASALLILVSATAPHVHSSALGTHACLACVAAGGEEAAPTSPDVAPRRVVAAPLDECALPEPPVTGAPLGAVPGQSPPAA
jgi:hypothetical protein